MPRAILISLSAAFFFISGSAALIYQTSWQRLLSLFAGSDSEATGIIVAAFMLGLGVGHLLGGHLADRLNSRQNLRTLALLEAALAVFGYFSPWFYHDLLCLQLGAITEYRLTSSTLLFLLLMPPTLVMGLSLPLLMRGLADDLAQAPGITGLLYGINTLGAAAGALICPWILFPEMGIEGSLHLAALLNGLGGLGLLVLSFRQRQDRAPSTEHVDEETSDTVAEASPRQLTWLFATSGFLALGLEMIWFRVLGVVIKSTALTFGTLLSFFLFGLGLGSLAGIRLASRLKRPLLGFVVIQCSVAAYAGLSMLLLVESTQAGRLPDSLQAYLGGYEPLDLNLDLSQLSTDERGAWQQLALWLYGLLPLILIGPPTFLMGLSFPLFQKAIQHRFTQLGQTFGNCQSANIAGSVLGALSVSFILLPVLGSSGTLSLLISVSLLFLLPAAGMGKKQRWGVAAGLIAIALSLPTPTAWWAALHGSTEAEIIVTEDSSGVAAVKRTKPTKLEPWNTAVHVNGIGQSWAPYGGIHSILGALPALLHPRPESIALVGLGSGDTAYASAARYETQKVVCIEIISGLHQALKQQVSQHPNSAIGVMLADPQIHHVSGDGRRFLMATNERFDIIEADALRPNSTGSGNLYSEEYFRLIARKLKPGGYAVTWVPTPRVRRTFYQVFPHVLDFGTLAIGSVDPITCTAADLKRRIGHLEVRQHFRAVGIDIQRLMATFTRLDFARLLHAGKPESEINTDLFPRDEFELTEFWKNWKSKGNGAEP